MKIHQVPHKTLATSLLGGKGEPWLGRILLRKTSSNLLDKSSKDEPDNLERSHCFWRRVREDADLGLGDEQEHEDGHGDGGEQNVKCHGLRERRKGKFFNGG